MNLTYYFHRLLCLMGMSETPKTLETIQPIYSSGMETPSLPIKAKLECAESPKTVLTATAQKVLSTNDLQGDHKVSLTSIAAFLSAIDTSELVTAIGTVATVVKDAETVIDGAEQLISWVKSYVTVVEDAYSTSRGAGATKLKAVLAAAEAAADKLGVDWDVVKDIVTAWINSAIALWNAVKDTASGISSAVTGTEVTA